MEILARAAPGSKAPPAAVAVLVLAAALARDRTQRLAERPLFGTQRDPLSVPARMAGSLDLASGRDAALVSLVDELRQALKLPYVGDARTTGRPRRSPSAARRPSRTSRSRCRAKMSRRLR